MPKSTNTEIVDEMIGVDLHELRDVNAVNAANK